MKTTKVICENCKREFEKKTSEVNRSKKLGRKCFCNRSCAMIHNSKLRPRDFWKNISSNLNFKKYSDNRRDEFSAFRFCLGSGRASIIKHKDQIDIDLKYLKELWETQKGICPYTGIKMILPETTKHHYEVKSLIKASLDRIDSNRGYVKGNVEFVCHGINNAKNNFSKEDMKTFISLINLSVTHS